MLGYLINAQINKCKCFLHFIQIEGWPGENIKTTVIAQDQLGKPCGSLTHLVFSPNTSNEVVPENEVCVCYLCYNLWLFE